MFMKKWGIRQRVLFLTLVPSITISLLLGVYFISIRLSDIAQALNDRGTAIAARLASGGEYGVFAGDTHALRKLARLSLDNEISSVVFYNKEGHELASAGKISSRITPPAAQLNAIHIKVQPESDTLAFIVPVTLPDLVIDDYPDVHESEDSHLKATVIGWLKVELERKAARLKEYQVLIHSALIVLLGLSISGLIALRMGHRVTTPILQLTEAVQKIREGKLDTRVHTKAFWEFEILQSGINNMASSLQSAHEELQSNIQQATADLRNTLETIEVQNIELEMARKEAETASAVKSDFLASMSHELRTPLNGIIGFINLLQKSKLNEQQRDYLLIIQKSSSHLLSIINDILDFSKLEAGKLRLNFEPMDLRDCIEDAVILLAPSAHDKHLEIIPFIHEDVPQKIEGDALRIKQVITNLVNNSIKFTEEGSVIIQVTVEKKTTDSVTLCISVADTGIGLTEEQQTKLFRAFNQVSPNISRKFGGTGLGLVICKRLVEQMHGSIQLESAPGKGSRFWFTLQSSVLDPPFEALPSAQLTGFRILVYEKHPVTRLTLMQLLKQWGIQADEISDIENIASHVQKQSENQKPYDMLIAGLNDSKKHEAFVQNLVATIKEPYQCPLGILVNTTDYLIHNEILLAGASLCLAKPISRKKLLDALSAIFIRKEAPTMPLHKDLPPLKILVVDDNLANLKLACALLYNIGVQVVSVVSGVAALEKVEEEIFHLILMDIHMPQLDGFETSKTIRTGNSKNKKTPIVALSAQFLSSDQESFEAFGINDYLTKPISEHLLRATLYKWTYRGVVDPNVGPMDRQGRDQISEIYEIADFSNVQRLPSIDWNEGVKLAAGKEDLAQEMLSMLIQSLGSEQEEMDMAHQTHDWEQLRELIHKLHGACCYCGVPKLRALVKLIEKSLKNPDPNNLSIQMYHLNAAIQELQEHFWNDERVMQSMSEEV